MASSNKLEIIIKAVTKDFDKGLGKAVKGLDTLKDGADKVASTVLNLKNAMVGLVGAFGLGSVLHEFAAFDDMMRQAAAVSNATGAELADMTDIARKMGSETRYTATQAADALVKLGMAGLDAHQQMKALPSVLQMSAAGNLDLATSADIATNVMSAYGMQAESLGRVNDVLTKAFTSSNSTLQELGEAFKYVAPIAKGVGVEFEGLVAPMALLHSYGIKGSMAGTALRGAIDGLMNPTEQEALLMDKLSKRMGGVTLKIKDSEGKFLGFTSVIGQLEKAGISADEALNLFGLRAGPAMAALIQGGSKAVEDMRLKLRASGGTAERVAKQMEAGLGGAFRSLGSRWESLKITLGSGFEDTALIAVRFFIAQLDTARNVIESLIKSGNLGEWAGRFQESFLKSYEAIKLLIKGLFWAADATEPLIKRAIALAPYLIGLAAAAKTASMALGALKAILILTQSAMGVATISTWIKHVQLSSKAIGMASVATASWQTALTSIAAVGAAAFVGWQVGKLIGEMKLFGNGTVSVNEKVQQLYASLSGMTEELQANTDHVLKSVQKFKEFANIKIEGEVSEKTLGDLEDLQSGLQKAYTYNLALRNSLEQKLSETGLDKTSAEAKAWQAELERVQTRIKEIQGDQQKVNEAIGIAKIKAGEAADAMEKPAAVAEMSAQQMLDFEEAAKKAYRTAKKEAEEYGKEVLEWEEKIRYARMSTEDKLRELGRKGLSEEEQWNDKKLQAEEKMAAAKAALKNKDYDLAEKLAKQTESLYADLATEVRNQGQGDAGIAKSIEDTKEVAMAGVTEVGKLTEKIYQEQKEAAQKTADQYNQTAENIKAGMDKIDESREKKIGITLDDATMQTAQAAINEFTKPGEKPIAIFPEPSSISGTKQAIAELVRPETKTVYVETVEKKANGGQVGLARGGRLPGFGGGDRISALLEAGEYVINKFAVRKYGSGLFHALNQMSLPSLGQIRMPQAPEVPRVAYQSGGFASGGLNMEFDSLFRDMGKVEIGVGNRQFPVFSKKDVIEALKQELLKERKMRTNR